MCCASIMRASGAAGKQLHQRCCWGKYPGGVLCMVERGRWQVRDAGERAPCCTGAL